METNPCTAVPLETVSLEDFAYIEFIAEGGYGIVDKYLSPTGELVAIKRERALSRITRPILDYEYKLLQLLKGHPCIPRVYAYGTMITELKFRVVVMELLGPTVATRFRQSRQEFTAERVAKVGLGMLTAVEYIHSHGFIHRDLKPENFIFGRDDQPNRDTVHIIDFGFAHRYRDRDTNVHFAPGEATAMGTPLYSSLSMHLALSRRDDLQTLSYILVRLIPHRREKTLLDTSKTVSGAPQELERFVSHCFSLEWSGDPDYDFLRSQLSAIAGPDTPYSWSEASEIETTSPLSKEADDSTEPPSIRRGDLILARVLCKESLEYDPKPREPDRSYYHRTGDPEEFPFRPAIVRSVARSGDHLELSLYSLTKDKLEGLGSERRETFRPFPSIPSLDTSDLSVYGTAPSCDFHTQITTGMTPCRHNLPDLALSAIERQIGTVRYGRVYTTDNTETSTLVKNLPKVWPHGDFVLEIAPFESPPDDHPVVWDGFLGWSLDIGTVQLKRKEENGQLIHRDIRSYTKSELAWSGPVGNLPLSCEL
ncbi:kinase-like domain-containing protein [Rhodocollybia butyracea]|uniref:non-specific serine/threonine protein kinase n=1 Tax=Rhodocollybia butyracea TaxID=206335 RepID=A0A9P5UG70_9AGAR|nr:kinase-like domain-containing protein [Rhodocollybia butyracea]